MKLQVKDKKGRLLKEHFFDFARLLEQAQSQSQYDPIKAAANLLCDNLDADGISIEPGEKLSLQKQLDETALSEDESRILKVIGHKTSNSSGSRQLPTANI